MCNSLNPLTTSDCNGGGRGEHAAKVASRKERGCQLILWRLYLIRNRPLWDNGHNFLHFQSVEFGTQNVATHNGVRLAHKPSTRFTQPNVVMVCTVQCAHNFIVYRRYHGHSLATFVFAHKFTYI